MKGYAFAIAYLWDKDPEFRRNLLASKGFCLPHLAVAHWSAGENLTKSNLQSWYAEVSGLQRRKLESLEAELKRFLSRYDYRSEEPQPESEKTVLLRAIRMLGGRGEAR